jgi:hypothetical protein
MRKLVLGLVLVAVFAVGLSVGLSTPPAEAGFCYWTCDCAGVPLKCCITPFGVVCKPDPKGPWQCPQVYDC